MAKCDIDTKSLTTLIDETGIEAVAEMIGMFADETAQRLPRMQANRQAADWQALAYDAHALVSSAAQFGGQAVSRGALQLEQRIQQGDLAEAGETYAALIVKIEAFMTALQHFRARLIR